MIRYFAIDLNHDTYKTFFESVFIGSVYDRDSETVLIDGILYDIYACDVENFDDVRILRLESNG